MKAAVEAGYDVTAEKMAAAEKEFRAEKAKKTRLSIEELDAVAGGVVWKGEEAPYGHELGCIASYHHYDYQKDSFYCDQNSQEYDPYQPDD